MAARVFYLDRAHIQPLMYLKLFVAGRLTIFVMRTLGPFWCYSPRTGSAGSGSRSAGCSDYDRGLWVVHDTHRLGLGPVRMGLSLFSPRDFRAPAAFTSCLNVFNSA